MDIHNILVVDPDYQEIRRLIEQQSVNKHFRYATEVTKEDLQWADALVGFYMKGDIDYRQVKWVHSLGAGVDQFLFQKEWDEQVLLTRTICSFGDRIAQYCLSYLLKDLQQHDFFHHNQTRNVWKPSTPKLLNELKIMVYGTGEIGQAVAKTVSYFGAEVVGVSLSGKAKAGFKEVYTTEAHYARLNEMDVLINTLPLTEKTERLFNADIFQSLIEAVFINVGRGASLDEEALLAALNRGKVRYAVLDVFSTEPPEKEHPFWRHPKIYMTPHISAVTTAEEGVSCFLETLRNIEENKPLSNQVDIKRKY